MFRRLLEIPIVYTTFQKTVKTNRYETMLTELLGDTRGLRVLDFGCGPGDLLYKFKESQYFGLDPLEGCVRTATQRLSKLGMSGEVKVGDHESLLAIRPQSFDLIVAIGVLHHISDEDAESFIALASTLLVPNSGKLITLDPGRFKKQSIGSRFMVGRDRGRFVRKDSRYYELLSQSFSKIASKQHVGVLRMPYDFFSAVCSN
jgi:2-polyprenyl-3-methyl-5-hydroxy-6-metoxy-1,4-benzoquinol methylase